MGTAPQRVSGIEFLARHGQERASDQSATARRLLREFYPYRWQLAFAFALNLASAASQAAAPWLISRAIDRNIGSGDSVGLARTMIVLLAVYMIETGATRAQMHRITVIGYEVLASFRDKLFEHYLRLPLSYLNQQRIGDLISRAINDVSSLNNIFTQSVAFLPGYLISLVGVLVAMLLLNPRLAAVSFAVIPFMYLSDRYFAREALKAFRNIHYETGEVTAKLQEDISGVREAQAFNRVEANVRRFRERIIGYRKANLQAVGITSATAPTFDILSAVGTAVIVGYGAYLVIEDEMTVGLLTAFLIYVQQFYRPIQLLSQVRTQVQSSLAGSERIYSILDEKHEPDDSLSAITLEGVRGKIEFRNVSFSYEDGNEVLHDISFTVEPGQMVALVGQTGAGKTTIANMIPRFFDPQSGSVCVDGFDVRQVKVKSLRASIAIVPQEPFLFSSTIEENIGYACDGCPREQIIEAAKATGAHDFIEAFPMGYEARLSERGKPLSQGQRQLISITRAVLAKPSIIILDEAMGAIDSRSEGVIQRALHKLLSQATSVVIAHRLSTVRNANLILVIEGGRVAEMGRHDELLALHGRYYHLFRRQFQDS